MREFRRKYCIKKIVLFVENNVKFEFFSKYNSIRLKNLL